MQGASATHSTITYKWSLNLTGFGRKAADWPPQQIYIKPAVCQDQRLIGRAKSAMPYVFSNK